jgi:5-formaminoimidazole-4-carboxamide-1-beta-D-ribofuranosyl 5'-monophosphate synthetase
LVEREVVSVALLSLVFIESSKTVSRSFAVVEAAMHGQLSISSMVERHLRIIVYNLPTLIVVLGSNLGVLSGFKLTERIDVEVFISISLVLYF